MRPIRLSVLVALVALLAPGRVEAYSYEVCNGEPTKVAGRELTFHRSLTIETGSDEHDAYKQTRRRWNKIRGMTNVLKAGPTNLWQIYHGDGQSDAGVLPRSEIGGANGQATVITDHWLCYPWTLGRSIIEADVIVADDLDFYDPDETWLGGFGRATFLHEFGHALGLHHYQDFNAMRVPQPRPLVGGPGQNVDVLPDDANGGRFLYPDTGTHINVFATAMLRNISNDNIQLNRSLPITLCASNTSGYQFSVYQTAGNNGQTSITQTERWYVSQNPYAYDNGVLMGQWNNSTYPAGSVITVNRSLVLPYLSPGTWYLFHGVDQLHEHSERRELDNVSREGFTIQVLSC